MPSGFEQSGGSADVVYYSNLPARLIKCVGALLATNASWKLVIEASEEQRWILLVILNLFVMYVILVKEGSGSNISKDKEMDKSGGRKLHHSVGTAHFLIVFSLVHQNPFAHLCEFVCILLLTSEHDYKPIATLVL